MTDSADAHAAITYQSDRIDRLRRRVADVEESFHGLAAEVNALRERVEWLVERIDAKEGS